MGLSSEGIRFCPWFGEVHRNVPEAILQETCETKLEQTVSASRGAMIPSRHKIDNKMTRERKLSKFSQEKKSLVKRVQEVGRADSTCISILRAARYLRFPLSID